MRRAAPDILDQLQRLGVDFSCVDDLDKLTIKVGDTMVATGMCDSMKFSMEGKDLKADIGNCAFFDLTMRLNEDGIPPFGCPFAALTVALAERNLGKRARVKHLAPKEGGQKGDTTLLVELHDQ